MSVREGDLHKQTGTAIAQKSSTAGVYTLEHEQIQSRLLNNTQNSVLNNAERRVEKTSQERILCNKRSNKRKRAHQSTINRSSNTLQTSCSNLTQAVQQYFSCYAGSICRRPSLLWQSQNSQTLHVPLRQVDSAKPC